MNPKLQLSLSLAGAGLALISQGVFLPRAQAGPSFSSTSSQNYNAGANFNLQQAQTFSATGNYSGTVSPFAVTESTVTTNASAGTFAGVAGNLSAGTSTLTAAFDKNGFQDTDQTTSFAVQAGVISLGGSAPTDGITTQATTPITAGLSLGVVFNQNTTSGVPSIAITGAGSDTGIVGASITSQAIGASASSGNFTDTLTVVNSLTAF
ncbi:MAG: hypothetical protein VKK98_09695 [Cyanobacteriota bacterium]|nr:hypothetical protein [Cyanobacteriota bacterium]